jgi:hypothetical protein
VSSAYDVRRPATSDVAALRALASDVLKGGGADGFAGRWWWRDDSPHCWVAEHRETGAIAAICGSRRVRFRVDASVFDAT